MDAYASTKKPKNRHPLRLSLGRKYFTLKRHLHWRFGGLKFAKIRPQAEGGLVNTFLTIFAWPIHQSCQG